MWPFGDLTQRNDRRLVVLEFNDRVLHRVQCGGLASEATNTISKMLSILSRQSSTVILAMEVSYSKVNRTRTRSYARMGKFAVHGQL